MRRVCARVVAACVVALGVMGALVHGVAAHPPGMQAPGMQAPGMQAPGIQAAGGNAAGAAIVTKVHGFHCRRVLGWDPVAGVYRYHRHEGICHDYKRCLRQQKRCVFMLGRGFERWSYEAFGADNARFFACMIRSGCY